MMRPIPDTELRGHIDELLQRAEAGEEFAITVAGRPVARLGPPARPHWVSGPALQRVWATPAQQCFEGRPADLTDPFA